MAAAERIATFDNDGTLWAEQPIYVQFAFALDRVKALAPKNPDWKDRQPFKAVLEGDMKTLAAAGERGLVDVMMATHANLTTDDFATVVSDWIASARHPKTGRLYTDMVESHEGWRTAAGVAAGVATGIAVGTMLSRPPAASTTVVVSGTSYTYSDGVYYARVVGRLRPRDVGGGRLPQAQTSGAPCAAARAPDSVCPRNSRVN